MPGHGDNHITRIIQTSDGGFAFVGSSSSMKTVLGCKEDCMDAWIAKLDSNGKKLWERYYGNRGNNFANGIIQTDDGGFAVTGVLGGLIAIKNPGLPYYWDFFILKTDTEGFQDWSKTIEPDDNADYGRSIDADGAGGFIASGVISREIGEDMTDNDIGIVRIGKDGTGVTIKTFDYGRYEKGGSIFVTGDNSYVFASQLKFTGFVTKADTDGKTIWRTQIDLDPYWEGNLELAKSATGFYAADRKRNLAKSLDIISIYRLDDDGTILWKKEYNYDKIIRVNNISSTADGGAVIAGRMATACKTKKRLDANEDDESLGYIDAPKCNTAWIFKVDKNGNKQWERVYVKKSNAQINSIQQTSDGGYIAAGIKSSQERTNCTSYSSDICFDGWILKLDQNGNCNHCK